MTDESKSPQLTFYFEKDPAYRLVAANGVWGGVTSRGDFKVEFFVESLATPEKVVNELVRGAGKTELGDEVQRTPSERRLVRTLQFGIVCSLDNAQSFGEFLIKKVQEYRTLAEAQETERQEKTNVPGTPYESH